MSDSKSLSASREINAPAADIYAVLTNPDRHADFDASGTVRSADHPQRLQEVGQKFRMNMYAEKMGGDYQTDNHVTGLNDGRLVAWQTALPDEEPAGWEWRWELKPAGTQETEVTVHYDWSKVTDKHTLKKVSFPAIPAEALEGSLARLASLVEGGAQPVTVRHTNR